VLVPLIGTEFAIKSPIVASLYKLLLYKEDSFFKLHRDSEKEPGMFATVVVQLPSKYTGGELVVHHDNKLKTFDFSSTSNPVAEFSTFFTAFYCDCLHEIRPLTSGIRVCLIYNLCLIGENAPPVTAPTSSSAESKLGALIREWKRMEAKKPSKIIYALTHKYTQKNLSFENLKSKDKGLAMMLKQLSTEHEMTVLLAILKKTSSGNECGYDEDFDSEDPDSNCEREYELSNFRLVASSSSVSSSIYEKIKALDVDPDSEVIPENCWSSIEPYNKETEETGNAGVQVSLFYRHAALVIWPTEDVAEILNGRQLDLLEEIFLQEHAQTRGSPRNDVTEAKLLKWAKTLISGGGGSYGGGNNGTDLLSAIVGFDDLNLLKAFLQSRRSITPSKLAIILPQCEKYGWYSLSTELVGMFTVFGSGGKGRSKEALEMLRLIIGNVPNVTLNEEKRAVCLKLAQAILTSRKSCTGRSVSTKYWQTAAPAKTPAQKSAENEAEKEFLRDFYVTVKGIGFEMVPVVETTPLAVVVPVLFKLAVDAEKREETLENQCLDMIESVLNRMEVVASQRGVTPSWRRTDFKSCGCADCVSVQAFMQSNQMSMGFKMGKMRRLHLHRIMNQMTDVTHVTERFGNPQTMVISKTAKVGTEEFEEHRIAIGQKEKLQKLHAQQLIRLVKANVQARPAAAGTN